MKQSPPSPQPGSEPNGVDPTVTNVTSAALEPVVIELDDLEEARRDVRVSIMLKDAVAEGARVEQEGRQGW